MGIRRYPEMAPSRHPNAAAATGHHGSSIMVIFLDLRSDLRISRMEIVTRNRSRSGGSGIVDLGGPDLHPPGGAGSGRYGIVSAVRRPPANLGNQNHDKVPDGMHWR